MNRLAGLVLLGGCVVGAVAQAPLAAVGPYVPLETFAPLTLPAGVNEYRDSSGAPGPKYWQNRADYELHAAIDTAKKRLTATEVITYTNNSPDTLRSLWIHMEQNTYRMDARARAAASGGRRARTEGTSTQGFELTSVQVQGVGKGDKAASAVYDVADTRMQIQLTEAEVMKPGAKIKVLVAYSYAIPGVWGGRTSVAAAKQGDIFDMAQWYPRMCVYDDVRGWDTLPYLGNEFYLEYGHFDYYVTVPGNMIVAGSGELMNPKEVLTAEQMSRLAQARKSDKTVMIRTAEEATAAVNDAAAAAKTKTWHYAMDSTRDVVFSASAVFLWDAARMKIAAGAGKPAHDALAQSVYPVESQGDAAWGRSTEYLKDAIEHYSARWYPYPWPNAINVAGFSTGMEYPGVLFDGIEDKGGVLFWITAHEIGHTWFPMIVGSDERRDAWMDEGFNTFIDTFESDEFEGGVYGPKRDSEYAPDAKAAPADQIVKVIADAEAPAILTRADAIREKYRHPVTYFKSAFGLTLLRENILGPQRFDAAFRKYINDWAFKHPKPSDFFRAMESEGGEDLSYFWRGWYMNNWQMDVAVTAVKSVDAGTVSVTVENRGKLVVPTVLRVECEGGAHVDVAVPAETWIQNATHTFTVKTPAKAVRAVVDPEHKAPDADRTNDAMAVTM